MKSLINVQYNVYAPKAERNSTTHLNRVTRTVYPLGSQFKQPRGASSREQMRLLGHVNTKAALWDPVSEKRLNTSRTGETLSATRPSEDFSICTSPLFIMIYCSNTHCSMVLWQKCGIFTFNIITGVKVYNDSMYVWLIYSMCAFIWDVFRLFFIQIGHLKSI